MSSKRIEELDSNFKLSRSNPDDPLCWIDAFDPRIALRGLAWLNETAPQRSFRRLPDRAESAMNDGVKVLSRCPASAFLSFHTDSRNLSVRARNVDATHMLHMPLSGSAGLELYLREGPRWLPVMSAFPAAEESRYERELFKDLPAGRREFRLYLPLYKELQELAIGVDPTARVEPAPAVGKPIFIYGTSITQGGCANTAGTDYVSALGRLLDSEVINFGFSGNGRGEPEVAELISEIDAEMFVLDFLPNCLSSQLGERLPRFVEILRGRRPGTPIVLITNPCYNGTLISAAGFEEQTTKRDIALEFYSRARSLGMKELHLIDGFGLAPAGVAGTYVDGAHPTTSGFLQMAERLAPQLHAIRLWTRHWRTGASTV